ncbi:hypothetical protein GQ53DRAFT_545217 [Thozetella sp. PMI_491]|nr:hypothetical protein GQ53DRAFT_545217 [Thozetella sp. PMI_491]
MLDSRIDTICSKRRELHQRSGSTSLPDAHRCARHCRLVYAHDEQFAARLIPSCPLPLHPRPISGPVPATTLGQLQPSPSLGITPYGATRIPKKQMRYIRH